MIERARNTKRFSFCILLFYSCVLLYVTQLSLDASSANIVYSFLSVFSIFLVFALGRLNSVSQISVLNFFLIGYSVFVFGRCFYIVLSFWSRDISIQAENLYSLFWMADHVVGREEASVIFILTNFFILFFFYGFLLSHRKTNHNEWRSSFNLKYQYLMGTVFLLIAPYYLYDSFSVVVLTMQEGYHAKFFDQTDGSGKSSIVKFLFFISLFSLALIKRGNYKYIIILLLVATFSVLNGGRGGFVTLVFTLAYFYLRLNGKFNINPMKAMIFLLSVFFAMNFILSFSARSQGMTGDKYDLLRFLDLQGGTLGVISYSIFGDLPYEWHTLFQSFVPGMARFYSYYNPEVDSFKGSITTFISYHANPDMFFSGRGLGSSIVSELFLLSFNFVPVFVFLSFVLGYAVSFVEKKSYENQAWFVFLLVMLPILIHSPRNGFNVLLISSYYVAILISFFMVLSRITTKYRVRRSN